MWVWVRSEGQGEGEDGNENLRVTLTPSVIHTLTHPYQKYHHPTQDQILYAAQPTSEPAQFHERISARITVKSF